MLPLFHLQVWILSVRRLQKVPVKFLLPVVLRTVPVLLMESVSLTEFLLLMNFLLPMEPLLRTESLLRMGSAVLLLFLFRPGQVIHPWTVSAHQAAHNHIRLYILYIPSFLRSSPFLLLYEEPFRLLWVFR